MQIISFIIKIIKTLNLSYKINEQHCKDIPPHLIIRTNLCIINIRTSLA